MTLPANSVTAPRRLTRSIEVGRVAVGGEAPVSVQSMTNTPTADVDGTLAQVQALAQAGCDIIRISVPDIPSLEGFARLRANVRVPLVADIHFDYRLAVGALDAGADGVRINPGNIGSVKKVGEVIRAAADKGASVRIGVNAGSLERDILKSYGHPTPGALVESCLRSVDLVEGMGFHELKLSVKASGPMETVEAYRLLSEEVDYPLHIGVTEAGTALCGSVRTSVALGLLLSEGIGDTLRVSLSGDPVPEVRAGIEILQSLGMRGGPWVVACPTCARTEVDVAGLAAEVEKRLRDISAPLKVAVMGCPVNGPGEARESDAGIAGGKGVAILFVEGKVKGKVGLHEAVDALMDEVRRLEQKWTKAQGVEK
ncbi:MAG: flavodoxin-dependent (E)-4-hydroxy-3-methylbut-2-enyl-diphosphate synthase [Deltaproteobacteria bacterium]|nr:flavodoxin-dependent (E)-4-hydroxy-3-methylbut-2-enyl-diphosphate synthase [Deltaproteobacteria bacterium]